MSALERFRLDGRAALVTGANRGLGQAIAVGLAQAGANIIGLSRGSSAPETAAQVAAAGGHYVHITIDLAEASTELLARVIDHASHAFDRLDILVNNAGIVRRGPAIDLAEHDWDTVLQVNLKTVFFLAQAAARKMRDQGGGKIINVASVMSFQGGVLIPSYVAAKHGLLGVTRALANEWAPYRINVNAIAPGYFATDINVTLREDAERAASISARIPAGRWGQPDDLQGAAIFLASAASDYVHGTALEVDGGWLSR
jgi:2-deoxy-D-gluconate 3-dehydrogenase